VAVVTGASSGLGRRFALDLARRGATVVGVARRQQLLAELEKELQSLSPGSATVVCDVGDADAWRAELSGVEERQGRVDILIAAAAVELPTSVISDGDLERFRQVLDVNYFGVVNGTLTVLPGMLARGSGVIVNVSSDSARAPAAEGAAYASSKAAVSAFTESAAHEVAGRGVQLHVLYPGWVPTPMGLAALDRGMPMPPRFVRRSEEQISELVLERMGGDTIELNASLLPVLAPVARALFPKTYRKSVARQHEPRSPGH
jgi:NAD(P)-dependent dehydrogenase (short-subunit alcohol dehydrogenase family)